MSEHERNLFDFYAGLAMLGWTMNGDYSSKEIPSMAFDIAKEMIKLRSERVNENQENTGPSGGTVAVPEVGGRSDDPPEGIAALKKTKARTAR